MITELIQKSLKRIDFIEFMEILVIGFYLTHINKW